MLKKSLKPNLSSPFQVIGELHEYDDKTLHGCDMIEVLLPDGILISSGWSSENDANGCYIVDVTQGLNRLESRIFQVEPENAIAEIERLAKKYTSQIERVPKVKFANLTDSLALTSEHSSFTPWFALKRPLDESPVSLIKPASL